ncbi:uncharacterized protein HMPREF1541_05826 [Cyphellophora europaea CBS 101466]|uniref:CBM21 domain-containing protein n=1 Tax=Cyphellophora europaea (strain CBS 101466) TaxID=1220924 RepID=W2RTF5_CYPE1|nr:uncharacterized protein HMPREF1541_05826 [Cyphellophora europaea CBS 101466]ETN39600.1 hypothetical protein HMPREF1541_05826 [Cyphellophora europaea CBS 101466]
MPYTPPAQQSPETSKSNSPTISRTHSYSKALLSPELPSHSRPQLPRSAGSSSYLSKHRRSPSLNDVKELLHNGEIGPEYAFDPHGSLRQSPPPQSNTLVPAGMTLSPPDSAQNSGDEDDVRGRTRDLEADNLKELHLAIRSIEQRKSGSPNRTESVKQVNGAVAPPNTGTVSTNDSRPPLSREARKISHSRSTTDGSIAFESPTKGQLSSPNVYKPDSESDEDSGPELSRPPMLRKKSGELVRPALRASSAPRRPSSMPGTPTYSKAVHFDSHLEHVRHFLQVDRPLAVSAGSSPVETYESESEFPFGSDESGVRQRGPSFEWEIKLANFPHTEIDHRKSWPVHVERIFLSSDNKTLIGSIAVQNLAFQKQVVSRFTFDYWKTTSEVVADFSHDVRRKQQDDGLDRFNFVIKLADQVNLENKTLFFCVKYAVNGTEYWDNNNGVNYQVDFSKKTKPVPSKHGLPGLGARPLSALPRSRPSPPTSSGGRPKSFPISFDDFSAGFDTFSNFGDSATLIGEPKIKLRSPRSKQELVPDAPARRPRSSGNAFGTRYDFNSSLSAAKTTAISVLGEKSGLSPSSGAKQTSRDVPVINGASSGTLSPRPETVAGAKADVVSKAPAVDSATTDKPAALLSEKPPLTSQSYQELVEKYCFVGTRDNDAIRTH